jgi:hypothetical protein
MRKYWFGAAAAIAGGLAIAACGSSSGSGNGSSSPPQKASSTSTTAAQAAQAPAPVPVPAPAPAPAQAPAPSSGSIPNFQPSTVVSQSTGHTQLRSSGTVAALTSFYENALQQDGWSVSSSSKTATSANFVGHRSGEGATVSISTLGGSGSTISISTYPQ